MTARDEERWPAPRSVFELRRHMAGDHGDDRWGGNWTELDALHQQAHDDDGGAGHEHEEMVG